MPVSEDRRITKAQSLLVTNSDEGLDTIDGRGDFQITCTTSSATGPGHWIIFTNPTAIERFEPSCRTQ